MNIRFLFLTALSASIFCVFPPLQAGDWPEIHLSREMAVNEPAGETVSVVNDPVYRQGKRYRAYPLRPFVEKLAEQYRDSLDEAVIVFTAIDGYKVSMTYPDAMEEQGYLAFQDLDAKPGKWRPFKFGKDDLTPAPFYLIWSNPDIDKWRFPWPFQLDRIALQPATAYFGKAAPSIDASSQVGKGFSEFSRYCIRCHAMNGSGGKVGPELNSPSNVSERYSNGTLKGLILNNPDYRPNSKMPVFADILNEGQMGAILAYLQAMKGQKIPVDEDR